jgi:hypothetical protein
MWGMKNTTVLMTEEGKVRLAEDTITGSYSIGLRTDSKMEWKCISKELHNLLKNELEKQTCNGK